jgi:hypothetical protein
MSEFRQDYLGNYTIPSHPLATSILTSQTQAILSEGDGDKIVRDGFSSSRFIHFCLLLLVEIIFGSVRSGPVQSGRPIRHVIKLNLFWTN